MIKGQEKKLYLTISPSKYRKWKIKKIYPENTKGGNYLKIDKSKNYIQLLRNCASKNSGQNYLNYGG